MHGYHYIFSWYQYPHKYICIYIYVYKWDIWVRSWKGGCLSDFAIISKNKQITRKPHLRYLTYIPFVSICVIKNDSTALTCHTWTSMRQTQYFPRRCSWWSRVRWFSLGYVCRYHIHYLNRTLYPVCLSVCYLSIRSTVMSRWKF